MPPTLLTILTLAVPPTCLRHCLPSLRSQCPPDMPATLLTILTLAVPSRHASDAAYHPYADLVPSQHASNAAYHPCAHMPSRHASNTPYHPYARSALLPCLRHCLPSLRLQCPPDMPPMLLTILMLTVPSQHASDAAYHPYAHVVPSRHASTAAYHSYAHSALPTSLPHRSPSALLTSLRRCLPSLRLQCPPDMPPTLLTILTLIVPSRHASNAANHPYAHLVSS
ncbi:hypothetical protein O181_116523 [Austropuccinia psidii MF-1]|uniref:Uncharacterized protein n=1 Tax=Austropuccinia psidii MF-1 TaxID=1389203 RepID=A0A9Q3K8H1_9BASI|nr:hypothetical protein [Austropuccinia psidii MF-1]